MGWAIREATPATVPLVTDLRPEETPAHPSLGLRVEKSVEKSSEASVRSDSRSSSCCCCCWDGVGWDRVDSLLVWLDVDMIRR